MTDHDDNTRREIEDRFIEVWGEISALWGVNKSVGRIQALLYLAAEPLDIEFIGQRLQISHGNTSTSIRDLLGWGVIRRVHNILRGRARPLDLVPHHHPRAPPPRSRARDGAPA
jgi:DNA-binding transcriptional regulator GbsR (MarR family)